MKERDGQPSPQGQPHGYLIDLEADRVDDLGALRPHQPDNVAPVFDPSSRYVVRGGEVFSTAPFARVCDLP